MKDYFIIASIGRSGTLWLTNTLSQFEQVNIWHDLFFPENFNRDIKLFENSTNYLVGTVSGPTRYAIKELNDKFNPKWGWLWRDPLETLKSHVEMTFQTERNDYKIFSKEPVERRITRFAHMLFSDIELSLQTFKYYNIPVKFWHLEKLTKDLQPIINWLGIVNKKFILPPKINTMPDHDKIIDIKNWSKEVLEKVNSCWNLCLLTKQFYES